MSRRLRISISVVVLLIVAFTVYRWFDRQPVQVEPPIVLPPTDREPNPTTPGQSSVSPSVQVPVVPTAASPDGKYPYYLGINERQYVTVYQWVNGNLVVFDQTVLPAEKLRQEDIEALRGYVGVSTEEEAYQRIEGLSH